MGVFSCGSPGCQAKVKLACSAAGITPKSSGIKRLKWIGAIPNPHSQPNPDGKLIIDTEYQPFDFTQELKLDGEETCLLRLTYDNLPAPDRCKAEEIYLSERTMTWMRSDREEVFTVKLPETSGKINSAKLGFSLFRDNGFAVNPRITVNGKPVTGYDFTWTSGISMFNSLEEIALPVEYLKPGENIVGISFPSEGVTGKTLVSSLRLRISQEVKAN